MSIVDITTRIEAILAENGRCIVAIDGGSGSGKTTLANELACRFSANVTHADDFFLQANQRTPERLAEPGGNLDRERFRDEVLEGIRSGKPYKYRLFDCQSMTLSGFITVHPAHVELVEGSYTHHPELRQYYDLTVWLDLPLETRLERIKKRNPAMYERFRDVWLPMEDAYNAAFGVAALADMCVTAAVIAQ